MNFVPFHWKHNEFGGVDKLKIFPYDMSTSQWHDVNIIN
jgi:hypothetical protein